MSNFITNCINGDALMSEVNDYIDKWHDSITDAALHDYLGMTKKEYMLFVDDENYLGLIIAAHKSHLNIESLVRKEMLMAARSEDVAKSRNLQKWLESEGLWD